MSVNMHTMLHVWTWIEKKWRQLAYGIVPHVYSLYLCLTIWHLDEDNEFHSAVMENLLDCSYPYHEMNNNICIPFEVNDSIDTPLTEVDPDIQFYWSVQYIQSTKCDYYLKDKFISIIAEKIWKRKKFVIFSYQHQKLTQTLWWIGNISKLFKF